MQWIHITQSAIYDINHTIAIIIVVVIVVKDDNGKNNGSCLVNDNKLNGRKWEEMNAVIHFSAGRWPERWGTRRR